MIKIVSLLKINAILSMIVFVTDNGYLMEDTDFVPYILWIIEQYRAENKAWESILTADFWGEQLLVTQIMTEIKELIK